MEIEIELLTEEEATEKPSGKARDDPNQHPHLDPPKYVHTGARCSSQALIAAYIYYTVVLTRHILIRTVWCYCSVIGELNNITNNSSLTMVTSNQLSVRM